MPVPDFQSFMLPLLRLTADGEEHSLAEAVERLAQEFQLTEEDRAQLLRSGQTRLYNRVGWTTTYLRKAGLLRARWERTLPTNRPRTRGSREQAHRH
jgi:restriction system protein